MHDRLTVLLKEASHLNITRMSQVLILAKLYNANKPLPISALVSTITHVRDVVNIAARRLCVSGEIVREIGPTGKALYRSAVLPNHQAFQAAASELTWEELLTLSQVSSRHDLNSIHRWLMFLLWSEEPMAVFGTSDVVRLIKSKHGVNTSRSFIDTLGEKCLPEHVPMLRVKPRGAKRYRWVAGPGYRMITDNLTLNPSTEVTKNVR